MLSQDSIVLHRVVMKKYQELRGLTDGCSHMICAWLLLNTAAEQEVNPEPSVQECVQKIIKKIISKTFSHEVSRYINYPSSSLTKAMLLLQCSEWHESRYTLHVLTVPPISLYHLCGAHCTPMWYSLYHLCGAHCTPMWCSLYHLCGTRCITSLYHLCGARCITYVVLAVSPMWYSLYHLCVLAVSPMCTRCITYVYSLYHLCGAHCTPTCGAHCTPTMWCSLYTYVVLTVHHVDRWYSEHM